MPTPAKPVIVLEKERKSHRTKAELAQRKAAEKAMLSGVKIKERQEVKNNEIAHKEFKRLIKMLNNLGKNDGIYEAVINRYCELQGEIARFEEMKFKNEELMESLCNSITAQPVDILDFMDKIHKIEEMQLKIDKAITNKRKMLFSIEKENIMTIASALRSVPKTPEKKESPLKAILSG